MLMGNEGLNWSSWWEKFDRARQDEKLKMLRGPLWEILYGTAR